MLRLVLPGVLYLLTIGTPGKVQAWDAGGHRAVCLAAWNELSEPARDKVNALLAIDTAAQFADTCHWADEILPTRPETQAWHVVNIPEDAREIDPVRDCPQPASCVIEQITWQAEILRSKAPPEQRADALKFLAHFVGDLHQPLNIGFAADGHGEKIGVIFQGRTTTMKALWDRELLATQAPLESEMPQLQEALRDLSRARWKAGWVNEWAQETLWIMRSPPTGYVGNPGGLEFGDLYVRQNHAVAADQIEKAGIRLGKVLNDILG